MKRERRRADVEQLRDVEMNWCKGLTEVGPSPITARDVVFLRADKTAAARTRRVQRLDRYRESVSVSTEGADGTEITKNLDKILNLNFLRWKY